MCADSPDFQGANIVSKGFLRDAILMIILFLGCIAIGVWLERYDNKRALANIAAAPTIELPQGARLKVTDLYGRRFLVAEFVGVGAGMQDFIPTTCETYITKPDGTREYGARFNCPVMPD